MFLLRHNGGVPRGTDAAVTMAWWQIGVLGGLILVLAFAASLLRGRGRNGLFLLLAALAGVVTWVTVGLMLGAIAPGRTGLMLPADTGLVPAPNEALRQERLLYNRLVERHPEAAPAIAEIERLRATGAEAGLRRARLVLLANYLSVYAPRASDASIRAFAAVATENLQALLPHDAMACRDTATRRHAAVAEEFNVRLSTALIDLLGSALNAPQNPPDAAEAIALRRQVIDALYASNDATLVDRPLLGRSADAPPEAYCRTFIRVFQGILALPPEQGSKVLRFYYGQEGNGG